MEQRKRREGEKRRKMKGRKKRGRKAGGREGRRKKIRSFEDARTSEHKRKRNLMYSGLRDCYMPKTLHINYLISQQSSKANLPFLYFLMKIMQ